MRRTVRLFPIFLLFSVVVAHQATTFGVEDGQANLSGVIVFTLASVLVILGGTIGVVIYVRRQKQSGGLLWRAVPVIIAGIVAVLLITSLSNLRAPKAPALVVELTGQRFWWAANEAGLVTAGEIWVPVGQWIELRATSADVFHTLDLPALGVKIDAIPGQTTKAQFRIQTPGVYEGNNVEYNGPSYDRMRLRIIALPEETFDAFVRAARAYTPAPPDDPLAKHGLVLFQRHCASCHPVKGQPSPATPGPDLTLFWNRTTIASGVWPNRPSFLKAWIQNAPEMKPGVGMPAFDLSREELGALVAYLQGLGVPGFDFRKQAAAATGGQ